MEFWHTNPEEEPEQVPVPAFVPSLPCLQSLSLSHISGVCFEGWACRDVLQSLDHWCCSPAERGFALQALPALTRLALDCMEGVLQQLPCSLQVLHLSQYARGYLTEESVACVQSSLLGLYLDDVHAFPATVVGLRNLEHMKISFSNVDLHVPAELQACARLAALTFLGGGRYGKGKGVH